MLLGYEQILSGAAASLQSATCGYWDDIRSPLSLADALSITLAMFAESNQEAAIVDIRGAGWNRTKRQSYSSFVRRNTDMQIEELSVYAKTSDEMAQIWSPPAYAMFRFNERVNIVGVYTSPEGVRSLSSTEILRIALKIDAGAAYRFSYPLAFSPVAYMNGLTFSPNQRDFGALLRDDEIRVANYKDHCSRGNQAKDGYIRDIYDLVLFNEKTANREVHGSKLQDWITSDPIRGSLVKQDRFFLWRSVGADLRGFQQILDSERILLAGFEPG